MCKRSKKKILNAMKQLEIQNTLDTISLSQLNDMIRLRETKNVEVERLKLLAENDDETKDQVNKQIMSLLSEVDILLENIILQVRSVSKANEIRETLEKEILLNSSNKASVELIKNASIRRQSLVDGLVIRLYTKTTNQCKSKEDTLDRLKKNLQLQLDETKMKDLENEISCLDREIDGIKLSEIRQRKDYMSVNAEILYLNKRISEEINRLII